MAFLTFRAAELFELAVLRQDADLGCYLVHVDANLLHGWPPFAAMTASILVGAKLATTFGGWPLHPIYAQVAFPLAELRRDSERPRAHREPEWTGSGALLLIDDDDGVRSVVAQLLTLLGFDVTAANGGLTGLELFRRAEAPFKFVVLDWIMLGFSGEQVLRALRELEPELPVVLISGYSAEDLAAYDARVVRVQKPMTLAQLRDAVRTVIAGPDLAIAHG